ncbi:hypothetical protein L227DRAFT_576211, partial [Lentinus tigrinus ALCF2SS1-6]
MQPASMPRSPQCENVTLRCAVPGQQWPTLLALATRPRAAAMMGLEWVIRPGVDAPQPRTTTSLRDTWFVNGC